uniref:Uncharacterized protein n=1 Tax=uncultured Elusimicrobia bacterium TaxID=699876 RepID=A0A650F402_9BACT|nr:hypothetical protein Elusimicrob1349_1950 [uncultured Elusimicrobia bacterium]
MNEKVLKFLSVVVKIAALVQTIAQVVAQAFPVVQKASSQNAEIDSFFKEKI